MGVGYTGSAEQQVQRAVCRENLADGGTMVYDVIVIGAGLGGLTAGAKLAKEGKKILLIEQHTIPGGCATTFRRKDLKIEVGLHELDGLDPGDMKLRAFQDLGVLEHVEFVRLPEFYRLVKPGLDIVIPDDYEQAVAVLTERFPAEGDGIRKFFKVVLSLRKETSRMPRRKWLMGASMLLAPFLYPNLLLRERWTVGRFLDSLFKDEDLKIVLLATLSYYHHDPYSMSLHFFALAQGSFFSGGSYFIKGGSQELSDYLASVIEDHEGKIVYRRLVHEIVIEDGAAVGVRYGKSQDGAGNLMTARGKRIVANAAVPNVVEQLLHDAGAKAKLSAVVGSPEIATSITTVYLGFKKPPRELGNRYYSTFLVDEGVASQRDVEPFHRADFSKRTCIFTDYSQIDSGLAPEGKGVAVVCTLDRLSDWEDLSDERYRERKDEVAHTLLARLEAFLPGIRDEVEYCEVGTPKTIRRYTLNPEGTAYGFAQTPGQSGRKRVKQRTPIPNLFFASAWTEPGHGFTGAIMSGYWCAEEILRTW